MPLPTAITCAGSWPEPDPWMTETLSSRGASARMIRLYSGMYLSVSGLASAPPLSISGTNCLGSLTNFFTTVPPLVTVVVGHGVGLVGGDHRLVRRTPGASPTRRRAPRT